MQTFNLFSLFFTFVYAKKNITNFVSRKLIIAIRGDLKYFQ